MSEIIKTQINLAKEELKQIFKKDFSDDRAFSHVLLKYAFEVEYSDQDEYVTDGSNDGGIDFLYFDEEESKLIVCQSKYTSSLEYEQIVSEFSKMHSTIGNFKKSNTGIYSDKLKAALQNGIDRLPDDNPDNIEYHLYTTAPIDIENAKNKINNTSHEFSSDMVSIFIENDIEKYIQDALETIPTVNEAKISIDRANNVLTYKSSDFRGILCNVSSKSIIELYNKFKNKGLFDLNIRRYIRNTLVDSGIDSTLDSNRPNFWFLNNGIIIACEDFSTDGDKIRLTNFSIVNGGQTTTRIGSYKGKNNQEFYIPCKIVATNVEGNSSSFFTKIAEATNSQKPIFARDLKSNAREMVSLSNWLKQEKIYLEIKRGYKKDFTPQYQLKNDELGQMILSFAIQRPGTSRSGKKVIFEQKVIYDQIFKVNYAKSKEKKQFIIDLIKMKDRYDEVEKKLKDDTEMTSSQIAILTNGRQTIFAILGLLYRIANNDIKTQDIIDDPKYVANTNATFVYGPVLSSYHEDDLHEKFETIIRCIVDILAESYEKACDNSDTTSVSNFMKTDSKYYHDIVSYFMKSLKYNSGKEILRCSGIFKR